MNRIEIDTGFIEISDPALLPNEPAISVMMLAYNHEAFLAQAIESVLAQRCDFPFELIIAEDCSKDDTLLLACDYQKRHPDVIRVITGRENVGIYRNFVRALSACRGNWTAFCEGDDYWTDESKLALQEKLVGERPEVDICYHSCMISYSNEKKLRGPACRASSRNKVVSTNEVIRGAGPFMPTASILVKTQVLRDLPRWLADCGGAIDVYIQAYGAKNGGAMYIDQPMSVYRVNVDGSWTNRISSNKVWAFEFWTTRLELIEMMIHDFPEHESTLRSLSFEETINLIALAREADWNNYKTFIDRIFLTKNNSYSIIQKIIFAIARNHLTAGAYYSLRGNYRLWRARAKKVAILAGVF